MVGCVRRKTVLPHIRKVWQLSERRACEIPGVNRRAIRYPSVRGDVDVALLARIKSIAAVRIRNGQRRIHVLLRREGWPVTIKRVARLYRGAGLAIRTKKEFEAELPITELGRRRSIHLNTIRLLKSKYAGLESSDLARLEQLHPRRGSGRTRLEYMVSYT